ncbi:MAG TPA: LuxR C-terminal-related transcriptional regulator [Solirubrobacteraceae bacterium]
MPNPGADPITVVAGLLDPLVGRGLIEVLLEDGCVEIIAADLDRHALERMVLQSRPLVAVVGETVGESLLGWLKARRPAPAVVVIVYEPTPQHGMRLLRAGATCIAQSADLDEVLAVVHRAARGRRAVAGAWHAGRTQRHDDPKQLTKRQAEVFRYLSEDMPYAVIAFKMKIGVQTVRTHAKAVFRALGVQNRQQLVGKSLPIGLGPPL